MMTIIAECTEHPHAFVSQIGSDETFISAEAFLVTLCEYLTNIYGEYPHVVDWYLVVKGD